MSFTPVAWRPGKSIRMIQKHLPILNMAEYRYCGHLQQMGLATLRFTCGETHNLEKIFGPSHPSGSPHPSETLSSFTCENGEPKCLEDHLRSAKGKFTCAQSRPKEMP